MKQYAKQIVILLVTLFFISCSSDEMIAKTITEPVAVEEVKPPETNLPETNIPPEPTVPFERTVQYLALGDSYTIGQSVCQTCRFPEQLKARLSSSYPTTDFSLKIIATTGWTTSNLISAIESQKLEPNYDLVTLLIGVNNQYQHKDFSIYKNEFPDLVNKAIMLAKGNKQKVIVLSIPDYAYTPFGELYDEKRKAEISAEIEQYNAFAENICMAKGVLFISITDITKQGLINTSLVASDGLHPSEMAYKLFVDRMLPKVKNVL